ncbi:MAG: ferredoxin, partial [Firmicutes bacterium]|nr:ferredoxin [Bacillota bacterium]
CKSPQQMFGAIAKTYYAEKIKLPAEKMYVVSVMPCTAKKFEAERSEMRSSGQKDVDAVLTTRELARMIKQAGIDFVNLPDEEFDEPLGISTGAAAIFGNTGGVMEAALRTAYEVVTGEPLTQLEFHKVRGWEGIRETEVLMDGAKVKVAVAHGLSNARVLLERIREGECQYHFIEVMACPGGCIGGGGEPIIPGYEVRKKRIAALYEEDKAMAIRKSHENPAIIKLYEEFLGEPLREKSHHLLHTSYTKREI